MNSENNNPETCVAKVLHIAPTPFFSNRGCHIRIHHVTDAMAPTYASIICTYHHGDDLPAKDIRRIWPVPGYTKRSVGYSPFKCVADIFLFFLVLKVTWKEKPVALHGHLHEGALIGFFVKILFFWRRIPLVMDMQGSLTGELEAYGVFKKDSWILGVFRFMERCIVKMPSHIFCSSAASRNILTESFHVDPARIEVTPDAVPVGFGQDLSRANCRAQLDLPLEAITAIYTGSLVEGKGIERVYEAFSELHPLHPRLVLLLVGYPVEGAKAWVQSQDLAESVRVLGEVPYMELARHLAAGDIALEPKTAESGEASGKMMHYMAGGLPVVCFYSDNNFEYLKSNAYFASTSVSFAQAFEQALQDRENWREKGKMNQERAKALFSWEAPRRIILDVYQNQLLRNNPYSS